MRKIYLTLFLAMVFAGSKIYSQTLTISGNLSPFTTCESSVSDGQSFTIEGTGLTSNIIISAPSGSGFLVSLNNSSFVPSLSLTPSAGIVTTTTIYVSLTGITSPGTVSGNISCTSTGATTQTIPVSGTVNPNPDVNSITNQTVCRNSITTAVNFTGSIPGTVYNWTNNNTSTGLAASGTGNIPSFTATNSTNAPITSTVTVTPRFGTVAPELLYYKFDGSGTTAPNLASNPPAGTATGNFVGTMSQGGSGICSGTLQSAGTNQFNYFNTGWAPNLTTSWTISFIASGFPTSGGGAAQSRVLGSLLGVSPLSVIHSPFSASGFTLFFGSTNLSTGSFFNTTKTVTFVYDMPADEVRAYINGGLVGVQSTGAAPVPINCPDFFVGNASGNGTPTSILAGSTIDEFRMYNRVLSITEIQSLVNNCDGGGVCEGSPQTFDITVYPDLVVNDPDDQTICDGSTTAAVNFTGTTGAVYNWTNNNPSIGLAANGTGNIPSFTPTFSGTIPVTATITVTPSFSGGPACTSSSQTFTITVNPIPDANPVSNQTVCNNNNVSTIIFSGSVSGTNYSWTNNNPSIGLAANGSGNIPSFTGINTTGAPITGSVTVTPSFGAITPELLYYKFEGAGTTLPNLASNAPAGTATATLNGAMTQGGVGTCGGTLQSNGVSVNNFVNTNWAANVNGSWTISLITSGFSGVANGVEYDVFGGVGTTPGSRFVCTYTAPLPGGNGLGNLILNSQFNQSNLDADFTIPQTITFAYNHTTQIITVYLNGTAVGASVGNMNINVPSFYIGNAFGRTVGSLSSGSSIDEFRIYNRLLSATEIAGLVNSCTVSGGCTGAPITFDITVLPSPTVDAVTNQSVCNNTATTAINFTGNVAGATYNWTNSNPSIGLAASGTGNIPSFVATNSGSTTQTATITVTPIDPNSSCPGTPESFTISVSPVPTGTATPASQTVCSESAINTISFTGNVPGITFDWTRDNFNALTGIPAIGTGNISGVLTNNTMGVETSTFTVTPSLGGCVGTPFDVTVTVKESLPVATATPTSQTICSGNITDIVPSANYAGATFSWTRDNTASVTGIAASGTGTISGTLFNTTTSPVTVTFTITPSFNGCDGAPITATVLVNAVPTITCPLSFAINNTTGVCGRVVNYNTTVTGAPAPTLSYVLSGATTGSGSGNGSGSLFNVGETMITITATNICGTATCSFRLTVVDTEIPTINCPANIQTNTDAGICAATVVTPNPATADNCAVTLQRWTLSGATAGSSPTTGINNVGTRLFNKGTTTVTYIIEDAAGNRATCSYTVTVRDLEAPVVICSPNITITTQAGLCVREVQYTVTATDNCPGVTTQLVSGPASGAAFPLGTTTVTWRAIDAATNVSTNCSFTVTVLDGQLPVISQQPVNRTVCAGSSATFSVTAATAPNTGGPIAYQWQQWSGLAWNNISGATSSTYTINNVTLAMNTNAFRVVLTGLCTTVNSGSATLFVNPLPTVSLTANALNSLLPAQTTSLVATVNPTGGNFVWRKNNAVVAGANGAVLPGLTVDNIGDYTVTYTDPNGCTTTSSNLVISGAASDKMWVYPNPNNGVFQVRFYNNFGEPAWVIVYNAVGQVVFKKSPLITEPYSRIDVNLGVNAQGVYIVKLYTINGKEIAAKRIVVYR